MDLDFYASLLVSFICLEIFVTFFVCLYIKLNLKGVQLVTILFIK